MKNIFKNYWISICIAILASMVFLTNLGGQEYSLDEPDTVAVAKNISMYGFPSAWDGKGFIFGTNGDEVSKINGYYIWTWHPWLQHYVAFAGMPLFGKSVGQLRILFALFGMGTVLVVFGIAQYLYKNKLIAFFLSLQLIFLLPFFLYIRQIRYYSLSAFFSVVIFWLLLKVYHREWNWYLTVLLSMAMFFLFMSNYIVWASSLVPLLLLGILKKNKAVLFVCGAIIIVAIGWLSFFKPVGGNIFSQSSKVVGTFINLLKYLSYLNQYILPLIFLVPVVFMKQMRGYVLLFSLWIGTKLLFYSFFQIPHGRYLVDLFPIIILLYGMVYKIVLQKKQYLLFVIFLFGALFLPISRNWTKAYAIELTSHYASAIPQVGKYLKSKYQPGDLFWSNAYFWSIYDYSGVPPVSVLCDKKTNQLQGPVPVTKKESVRWFIFFQHDDRLVTDVSKISCFGKEWQEKLAKEYTKKVFPLDKNTYVINDPDIVNRSFPPTHVLHDTIIIYERKK
jgi:hypothetical protein